MDHTPEPWLNVRPGHMLGTYEIGEAEDHLSDSKALPGLQYEAVHKANAERIMACVNACEGINPEAVPNLLRALQRMSNEFENNGLPMTSLPGYAKAAIALATNGKG